MRYDYCFFLMLKKFIHNLSEFLHAEREYLLEATVKPSLSHPLLSHLFRQPNDPQTDASHLLITLPNLMVSEPAAPLRHHPLTFFFKGVCQNVCARILGAIREKSCVSRTA